MAILFKIEEIDPVTRHAEARIVDFMPRDPYAPEVVLRVMEIIDTTFIPELSDVPDTAFGMPYTTGVGDTIKEWRSDERERIHAAFGGDFAKDTEEDTEDIERAKLELAMFPSEIHIPSPEQVRSVVLEQFDRMRYHSGVSVYDGMLVVGGRNPLTEDEKELEAYYNLYHNPTHQDHNKSIDIVVGDLLQYYYLIIKAYRDEWLGQVLEPFEEQQAYANEY